MAGALARRYKTPPVAEILILKTGALGDVLRTTSILPGIAERHAGARVTWLTAPGAVDLIRLHPRIARVATIDAGSRADCERARAELTAESWQWVISLDDEEPLCRLASSLRTERLSGAYLAADGRRVYTPDSAPWFDMGLLSIHGKAAADRMKVENRRSHAEILASMLGLPMGKPALALAPEHRAFAERFAARHRLRECGAVIGLNTGAGGRWVSKALPVERTVALALELDRRLAARATFVLFGGAEERERNDRIARGLDGRVRLADAGTDNALLDFAALVGCCDLLITSDSLAMHVGLALDVRTVAFFAPTSAAEIEMYGLGEKVASTAADACSYRRDADTSTLTVERLAEAALRQLALAATLARGAR
jgi:heptosyltransferase-2